MVFHHPNMMQPIDITTVTNDDRHEETVVRRRQLENYSVSFLAKSAAFFVVFHVLAKRSAVRHRRCGYDRREGSPCQTSPSQAFATSRADVEPDDA